MVSKRPHTQNGFPKPKKSKSDNLVVNYLGENYLFSPNICDKFIDPENPNWISIVIGGEIDMKNDNLKAIDQLIGHLPGVGIKDSTMSPEDFERIGDLMSYEFEPKIEGRSDLCTLFRDLARGFIKQNLEWITLMKGSLEITCIIKRIILTDEVQTNIHEYLKYPTNIKDVKDVPQTQGAYIVLFENVFCKLCRDPRDVFKAIRKSDICNLKLIATELKKYEEKFTWVSHRKNNQAQVKGGYTRVPFSWKNIGIPDWWQLLSYPFIVGLDVENWDLNWMAIFETNQNGDVKCMTLTFLPDCHYIFYKISKELTTEAGRIDIVGIHTTKSSNIQTE